MKNLSDVKIEKSKEFKLNNIEDHIKLNYRFNTNIRWGREIGYA